MPRPSRQLEFREVNFGYTDEKLNLIDVSFRIPVNTLNAFVGPSGSGKSTVLNLVTRFYEAGSGAVTIDEVDVRSVTQLSLRSHMSVVFQESFLFNTTVRENIRIGRPEASDADVEQAARAAEMHEIILAMPQGYDTLAGERGSRFSGGQRQRIAIARALLRDPAILVLDEATSALDPVTEDQINETLLRLAEGRTVLSVTHRLSPIAKYDRIFVLKDGRVVEQGPHAELLQQNGVYAGLWNKQSGFTISKEGDHVDVTADRLRAIPILSKLDPELLTELVADFITDRIPHDRVVVQQGDPADKFYVIVRGQVGVSIRNEDGTERKLTTLQDGDYFGEIALLRSVPRTATVRTSGECIFLTLPREKFSKLLERAPEFRELLSRDYPA
jgi:ATP-binding cassette subfamily B protein